MPSTHAFYMPTVCQAPFSTKEGGKGLRCRGGARKPADEELLKTGADRLSAVTNTGDLGTIPGISFLSGGRGRRWAWGGPAAGGRGRR